MLRVALFEPEIPPNTGNIARPCAATRVPLHIVGVVGFRLDEPAVRRAGLDYWPEVSLHRHSDIAELYRSLPDSRFVYFSRKAELSFLEWKFGFNDCLIFGPETRGLPESILQPNRNRVLRIPILNENVRSLNLSNAVAVALYEALRQIRILT